MGNFKRSATWLALAGMLVCSASIRARPAEDPPAGMAPATQPNVDPRADEILRAAGQYLTDAKSYTFKADVWEDVVISSDQKVQRQRTSEVAVRRPDRIAATTHNERIARGLWYDGKNVTIYNRQKNYYATVDAPDTIDKTIDLLSDKYGITTPVVDLIIADMYGSVMKNVTQGDYLGRQTVNGVRCHHLAYMQSDINWEMWVDDGTAPIIHKFLITYKNEKLAPQFTVTLSDWDFDPHLTDYAFGFRAPLDASKIAVIPPVSAAEDAAAEKAATGEGSPASSSQTDPHTKPAGKE